ncbi:MAG: hypothetical protein CL886_02545 [Dehalococcoidia bacterium]|nr:hypothetical protein [Dehalococcoidia bacterium]
MFLKVEPAGFFMYTVQLMFDCDDPTSEDAEVKRYLLEKQLEPRSEWEETIEGHFYQLMQFGGCYLGNHLQQIGNLQREAVESELISEAVSLFLDGVSCDLTDGNQQTRSGIEKQLICKFNTENRFSINQAGELAADIPTGELLAAYREILGGE